MSQRDTFEATYPRYPFPLLVEFGIALGRLLVRTRDRRAADAASAPAHVR